MKLAPKIKKLLSLILLFAILTAGATLLAQFNPLNKAQLQLSNLLYREHQTENPVVIVAINSKSLDDEIGLGRFKDWRRPYYTQVIENIEKHQPASVGIDIFFRSPSQGVNQGDLESLINDPTKLYSNLLPYSQGEIHPEDRGLIDSIDKYKNIIFVQQVEGYPDQVVISDPFFGALTDNDILGHHFVYADEAGYARSIITEIEKNPAFSLANIDTANPQAPLPAQDFLINYNTKTLRNVGDWSTHSNTKIVSFVDVYTENYPKGFDPATEFKDKIILIGAYYNTSGDNFTTPIDPENPMPGVQIHAQAIQTVLDQNYLRDTTLPEQAAAIAILTLVTLIAVFFTRLKYSLLIAAAVGAAYTALAAPFAFSQGVILNLVYPPAAIIASLIVGYAVRFLTESKQKILLHSALGKYVNKDIADQTLADPSKLGLTGEKREITVLFSDIKDFTSISEQLQAQSLVTFLNEYLQVMSEIITRHGGTIDKFEGDAIMAFFGAPTPQANHAIRACEAALEMRQRLPQLLQKWAEDPALPGGEKKPQIDFRVGLSTGEAIVGNVGYEDHIEYTAIGDIVNLGSRLESANKKYHTNIMISQATLEQIDDLFETRFLDVIKVKGKDEPIKVYELLANQGALTTTQKEILAAYHDGLKHYFEHRFIDALNTFNEILKKHPDDFISDIYAGRCEILKRFPPSSDWDFVYTMQTK